MNAPRVLEKYYTAAELAALIGFNARYWRDRMKAEPQLVGQAGEIISQCVEISGEFFAPASWANAYVTRKPVQYDPGIKARNRTELARKLASRPPQAAAA
jgi:hypothetical protein